MFLRNLNNMCEIDLENDNYVRMCTYTCNKNIIIY